MSLARRDPFAGMQSNRPKNASRPLQYLLVAKFGPGSGQKIFPHGARLAMLIHLPGLDLR